VPSFLQRLFAGPPSITVDELDARLAAREVHLLDVREDHEFKRGHVPGAAHVPVRRLPERIGKLHRDRPYAVICEHGNRSKAAVDFLNGNGFEGAVTVQGGTSAWIRSGRKVVR
jgi:rhodanese-related sulfurtransferase